MTGTATGLRICLVHRDLHTPTRGGIGTIYAELAPRLRDAGHQVTLLTQQSDQPLNLPGTTTHILPRTEDLDTHRRHVAHALETLRPDVVECSSWEAETLHYARRTHTERAPVVVRGEFSAATMQAAELVTAERELIHTADTMLAVSDFAAHDLQQTYDGPVPIVISNGVDQTRFHPGRPTPPRSGYQVTLDDAGCVQSRTPFTDLLARDQLPPPWADRGRPRVIWLGKITPMKGWDRLEQLVPHLSGRADLTVLLGHSRAFCRTTLSGDGDITICQDLDAADLVSFYRSADWLLSTSRWEGFGLAIAEALACGTPALLPAGLGTAPELLADGGGCTYADVDELIATIEHGRLPAARVADRFDWDHNAASTIEIYRTAIAGWNE